MRAEVELKYANTSSLELWATYNSDKIITVLLKTNQVTQITPKPDMREKHVPTNKLSVDSETLMRNHIESYHPSISHYRHEHAPFRRYLPPELTVRDMYKDFAQKYPSVAGYHTYRKMVSSMNISFVKLGEEECEECMLYQKHHHGDSQNETCVDCDNWKKHVERARISRKHYQDDALTDHDPTVAIMSVDMQKVIMLPRLSGVKTCVFTRRLVAFHETFAPLGSKTKQRPVVSAVWHEAVSGRSAEDLASVYLTVIRSDHFRDVTDFIFYADNCSAQNKNWTLFTALTAEVNRDATGPKTVTLRYLQKGHTFMSADSYHANVESAMRKIKNVFDFSDFVSSVERHGAKVIKMTTSDFVMWQSCMSSAKFIRKPMLSDVQEVQFRKGSTKLFWKVNMDDSEFLNGVFLQKKPAAKILHGIQLYPSIQMPRGIGNKKMDIVRNLCLLMPENKRCFWNSLPRNDNSEDLIDCQ